MYSISGVIAATVLVISLLRFLQIKRLKIRDKMKDGKKGITKLIANIKF